MNGNDGLLLRARGLVASALGLPEDTVNGDSRLGNLPGWDSIGHLNLMALLEREAGIAVSGESILQCTSVQGLMQALAGKGD